MMKMIDSDHDDDDDHLCKSPPTPLLFMPHALGLEICQYYKYVPPRVWHHVSFAT